ncbi:hypothetical protein [Arthrobacter sp. efr-133-TYG-120]|uniref:hypothetical protein n=1 Tax=Arthrobacter sp. efr-133-TYG-120 TaxID=3040280 RepID=UPI00254A943E|nr:hypothetical protein [Arthrobacter sp. efr-133-TYG-120]
MSTRNDRHIPRRRTAADRGIPVSFITSAELAPNGRIVVRTRGSKTAIELRSLGDTPAARQLTDGLLGCLHVDGGTWTSSATLVRMHGLARKFLRWLDEEHGILDLTAPTVTTTLVWNGVIETGYDGSAQRNLRTFLADTLSDLRHDGERFRDFLYRRSLKVDVSRVMGYTPEVAAAIEKIASSFVADWYVRHREAVQAALGNLPVDWLHADAARFVPEQARETPPQFIVRRKDLAAAMVLLALVDDKGPNLATIQSYTSDSVERSGDMGSFVTGAKARNHQILRSPSPAGGLFSYGGLLEFITAATRVDRMFRNHNADFDRLLFVATGASTVVGASVVNDWWKSAARTGANPDLPLPIKLSFQCLRKAATLRGKLRGHSIIGQKPAMARIYLKDAVPDVILVPGVLDTQDSAAGYWRAKTKAIGGLAAPVGATLRGPDEVSAAEQLAQADAVMDVGVAACASNGQSPSDESKPCGLGPVACFVCPNGYRTPEIVPGLLATVEFTEDIRKYEPEEWVRSEAPVLNSLARKALAQFPQQFVLGIPDEEIARSRVLIACVYMEGRSND